MTTSEPAGPRWRFCPWCGGDLGVHRRGGRLRPQCSVCATTVFHNPAVGVAVIVISEGRLLLGRRAGTEAGSWCIPCGYVEWDEEVRSAARRELAEETGLDVRLGGVYAVHSNTHDPNQHTVGIWFEGTVVGGVLRPGDDVDRVGYFGADDLPVLAFTSDAKVIDQLRADGLLR